MAKKEKQKLKPLVLLDILREKTDDEHGLTMNEIIEELGRYGIEAERKSLYRDIDSLAEYGEDIILSRDGRNCTYHIGTRRFELAELKLLVDSVQSARFITEKKSNELIRKIESLASRYEAQKLQRQVYVAERVKTMNESIYYNVDKLHQAINDDAQISFNYMQWNEKKQLVPKHDGKLYVISPWALCWNSDNYYLVAYDSEAGKIKHFRVDKMKSIRELTKGGNVVKREGRDVFTDFDMAAYSQKTFGMFGGEEQSVKLRCRNSYAGIIIDRFGKEINIIPDGDEHFTVNVDVHVSPQFLGWVIALGTGCTIVGPQEVVELMREEADRLERQYRG